ncbi:MAG: hypothetical protein ACREHG_04220 [Candidatus Saccharimonadales bacterium]
MNTDSAALRLLSAIYWVHVVEVMPTVWRGWRGSGVIGSDSEQYRLVFEGRAESHDSALHQAMESVRRDEK